MSTQSGGTAHQWQSSDPFDDSLLRRAVADGSRWAYGLRFVKVWVQNEITQLFRPESSWWIDPVFHSDCGKNCKICRLTNPERSDFLKPEPLFPGEGLPGVLFNDTAASAETVAWRHIKLVVEDPDQPWNARYWPRVGSGGSLQLSRRKRNRSLHGERKREYGSIQI